MMNQNHENLAIPPLKGQPLLDRLTNQSSILVVFMLLCLVMFGGVLENWFGMGDAIRNSAIHDILMTISNSGWLLLFILVVPVIGGIIELHYGQRHCHQRDQVVIFMTFLTILGVLFLYPMALNNGTVFEVPGLLGLGLGFKVDRLGFTALLITAVIWFLVMVYAHEYMKKEKRCTRFFFFMALTYSAVLGTIMAADLLTMFLFFEVLTVTSYMLVIHGQKDESFSAGYNFIIMGLVGGFMILVALLLLVFNIGDLRFQSALSSLSTMGSLQYWIMGLLVIGFGIKAGMAPVHVWLPRAHPVAPTPASALLSGIMIKVGAFGILRVATSYYFPNKGDINDRFDPLWQTPETIGSALIWLGIITMAIGVFLALQQSNIKRMLAYHSVSQMGYIVTGIGVALYLGYWGAMGFSGALYHIINHALFKSLLFMVAGVVYFHTREHDMYKLGSLWKQLPLTTVVCLIASLGISGIPLFNGFISKSILHHGLVEAFTYGHASFRVAELIFLVVSAGTVCSFIKMFYYVFLRKTDRNYKELVREYSTLDIAMAAIGILIIMIGLAPRFIMTHMILPQLDAVTYDPYFITNYIANLSYFTWSEFQTTVIVVALGFGIFFFGTRLHWFHLRLPAWMSVEYLFFYPVFKIMQKACRLMYGDKCPIDQVSLSKLSIDGKNEASFTERFVITIGMFNRRYESSIIKSDALIYTLFITLILLFMFIFGVV